MADERLIQNMVVGAIAVLTLVIIITMGAMSLPVIQDTQREGATNNDNNNQTVQVTNGTSFNLSTVDQQSRDATLISGQVRAMNSTGSSVTYAATNFTLLGAMQVRWIGNDFANNTNVSFIYNFTFTRDTLASNITQTGLTSMGTYSDFFT